MFRFFILLLFFQVLWPGRSGFGQEYLWPTNSGNYLSSTFGETRAAHFHAGLDIKTWGREGYEVYATRDGYVQRLLITERGYGRAVYLRHNDGTYSVYAHLQRFNKELQAYVDSVRLLSHAFEIEIFPDSSKWNFKKGDIIGFTGSTGIGPPHLHFELRDSQEKPFNALLTNIEVADNIPPVITSLIIEPLAADSRVNGKPISATVAAKRISKGKYDFGTVQITGKTGLAVNVYDMANEVYNKYAVFELSLLKGSDTIFYQKLDTFSYKQHGSHMFLDRITPFGSSNRGHQTLYSQEGSIIPFHKITGKQSFIYPAEEPVTYTIKAADIFGNSSTATVTISISPHNETVVLDSIPEKALSINNWYWHSDWASHDYLHTIDLKNFNDGFVLKNQNRIVDLDNQSYVFARIFPDSLQKVEDKNRNLILRFGFESVFDTLTIAAAHYLEDDSVTLNIQPAMLKPKGTYKLEYFLPPALDIRNNRFNLYRVRNNRSLKFVESQVIGKTVHAWPADFGEFVIAADNDPPEISDFRIYRTSWGDWQASVTVRDAFSGIDSETAEFWINDVRGIAEYDYEESLLKYHLPGFKPKSKNKAKVILRDKAGNQKTAHF